MFRVKRDCQTRAPHVFVKSRYRNKNGKCSLMANPFQHLSLSLLKPNWKSVYFHSILPDDVAPVPRLVKNCESAGFRTCESPPSPFHSPSRFYVIMLLFPLHRLYPLFPCIPSSFSSLCLSILLGHTFLSPSHGCSACRNITLGRVRGGGATGRGRRRGGEGWGRDERGGGVPRAAGKRYCNIKGGSPIRGPPSTLFPNDTSRSQQAFPHTTQTHPQPTSNPIPPRDTIHT